MSNPAMPPCQVCGHYAVRQWTGGTFCADHDTFNQGQAMINNPGDRFTSHRGITYEAHAAPTAGTCKGCAGDGPAIITPTCRELPTGCGGTGIIWIKVEDKH